MRMTPVKLIVLRLYMITLGRLPLFSKLLRQILVRTLVRQSRKNPYVASSRYFEPEELRT